MKKLFLLISFFLSLLIFYHFYFETSKTPSINEKAHEDLKDISENSLFLGSNSLGSNPICLKPTKNCQSDNAEIINLAKSLANGKSKYDGAVAIFNYLKANVHYETPMYYNTKYGALGTLHLKKGNCCDMTHLAVALYRAAGYPALYKHGNCYFKISKRIIGHVWSDVEVDGKWYPIDYTSSRNTFGVINSWTLSSLKSTTCELSF